MDDLSVDWLRSCLHYDPATGVFTRARRTAQRHSIGDRSDNRLCNLRSVTRQENQENIRKPRSDNTSGFLGVHPWPDGRWRASISVDGKTRHLGIFATAEEAHQVYVKEKRKVHTGSTL